ncbi:MAG: transketolase, partial [Nitrospirae bacterium RIFCSPHIGHO2_02_FULL_40_19]
GSLGQGLSAGVGIALNGKYLDKLSYRTFVLLGDSEMAEGQIWEAVQIAAYYKLDNLVAIIDVNRLGQRGETMYGHDVESYKIKLNAFGWETYVIEGHDFAKISAAFKKSREVVNKPIAIIAKTIKGKGVSFLEDKNGWHGKALSQEEFVQAVQTLGEVDQDLHLSLTKPDLHIDRTSISLTLPEPQETLQESNYDLGELVATREVYGKTLAKLLTKYPNIVVLDAEVSNSTYSEDFKKVYPSRFFEMFIAEQNMVSVALGLSSRGKMPFVSTFAAFFSRAFDQIRMSQYSSADIKFVGSHCGVSIGQDGPSQMGLEDIALFRSITDSVVFSPSDAVSCQKLIELAAEKKGVVYIRTARKKTPVIYESDESFTVGGSKILRSSEKDAATVIATGVTVHEALDAYEQLLNEGIFVRIVDLYCI